MATTYRPEPGIAYKQLLKGYSFTGFALIAALIILSWLGPEYYQRYWPYIAICTIAIAIAALISSYQRWEHKASKLRSLHVALAEITSDCLRESQIQSDEIIALLDGAKMVGNEVSDDTKALILNNQDALQLSTSVKEILQALKRGIQAGNAITNEINSVVISKD